MSRIDPNLWPDRVAFERHARALRRAETDRIARALAAWAAEVLARLGRAVRHPPTRGAARTQ